MQRYDPWNGGGFDGGGMTPGRASGRRTLWVIGAVAGAYLFGFLLYLFGGRAFDLFFGALALTPSEAVGGGFLWQLVTFGLLHPPAAVLEIVFNLLVFYWIATAIEAVWGGRRFLLFCVAATLFTGLCYCATSYLLQPTARVTGMAGLVMASLMVYTLWWPGRTVYFFMVIPMRIWQLTALVVLVSVLATLAGHRGNLAGGLVSLSYLGGLLFGWMTLRAGRLHALWEQSRFRVRENDRRRDEGRLDDILDKVHRQGMNSLNWRERRFLRRYSRERR